MKRILFIVPPYVEYNSFVNPAFNDGIMVKGSGIYRNIVADIPIGILSLSAYLKSYTQVEIKLIDFNIVLHKLKAFNYHSFSELFSEFLSASKWLDYSPNIIGISTLFTPSYYNMLSIAQVVRDIYPKSLIIAGGGVPANMYNEIFKVTSCFDALCYGEGEKPLLKLVQTNNKKELLETHTSWITKNKVDNKKTYEFEFIENLDEIPFLDYEIVHINDYRINSILATYSLAQNKMDCMPIITSRGCTHHCCFCASHTVHGRKMRYHSVNRVKEDLKRLQEQYKTKTIVFFDDHFMAQKQRVFKIINIMKALKLEAYFPSSLALYALDRKVLEALKSIGLNQIVLSVESGSNRVLKEIMHKPLNLSIINRVVTDCRELGISTDVAILIGLPGETKQDIEDARSFLKTINATWFRINVATPLVGSEMLDICIKNKYLKGDFINCDYKRAIVETEDFTVEYIQGKAYLLNLELNFIENSDYKLGNYETALKGFENTIRVRDDHAFAYYFAAKCCKMMNLGEKYLDYKTKYQKIIKKSTFWKKYANEFGLTMLE